MLAVEVPYRDLVFPLYRTDKIDGIRCLTQLPVWKDATCEPVSRALKPIPNRWLSGQLAKLPPYLDGELVAGNTFQETMSNVMTHDGWGFPFKYVVFDHFENPDIGYLKRVAILRQLMKDLPTWVEFLEPAEETSLDSLLNALGEICKKPYPAEGLIVRPSWSPYKYGRSTPKQKWMVKMKLFNDSEARIIGFKEMRVNRNTPEKNELGYQKRATMKDGMFPGNTLGALLVEDLYTGVKFSLGSGFDTLMREGIWDNRESFMGQIVKYKWQIHGTMDKPRIPIFIGIRDSKDM